MAFLPFGDGPRSVISYSIVKFFCKCQVTLISRICVGMRFALLQAKLAIVRALRSVQLSTCEKTEVSSNAICSKISSASFWICRFRLVWVNWEIWTIKIAFGYVRRVDNEKTTNNYFDSFRELDSCFSSFSNWFSWQVKNFCFI